MGGICSKGERAPFQSLVEGQDLGSVQLYSFETQEFDPNKTKSLAILDCVTSMGYANMYKGRMETDFVMVARFHAKLSLSHQYGATVVDDIKRNASAKHPNIMPIVAASFDSANFCYVTKYFSLGTLDTILKNPKSISPKKIKYSTLLQIAEGIQYLHSRQPAILHLNIRPASIWVDEKWNVCLGEFGFEKVKAEFRTQSLDTANYVYRDPNIYKGDSLTAESDIYSFGILMWELWTTKTPFDGCNGIKVGNDLMQGIRPEIPAEMPEDYSTLMKKAWDADKKERPSMTDIIGILKSIS